MKKGLEAARVRYRKGRSWLPNYKKRESQFLYDEQKLIGDTIAKQTVRSRSIVYQFIKN